MSIPWAECMRAVEARAGQRCEYCRMHQSWQGTTFHVEPILPRAAGGAGDLDNLAWACPSCNLKKSDRLTAIDPETGEEVALFHPRKDRWEDHFGWSDHRLIGRTAIGVPWSRPSISTTRVGC